MTKLKRVFPADKEYAKQQNLLNKLLDTLDNADTLHNAIQIANSKQSKVLSLTSEYEKLTADICDLTGTKNIGAAKKRIASLMKKATLSVAERFELDTSTFNRPSPSWITSIVLDDEKWEEQKLAWDKKRERWQISCEKMYNAYLEVILELCAEEELSEEDTFKYLCEAHESVCEDYLSLTYKEFFTKYDEDVDVSIKVYTDETTRKLTERTEVVDFSECLPFVKEFAPRELYREINKNSSMLGEVAKTQFEMWDKEFAKAGQLPAKEGIPRLRSLMRRITGAMVYRILRDENGWPTPLEEGSLSMLLSTPEENRASEDWEVDDSTTFTQFAKYFEQLTGAEK